MTDADLDDFSRQVSRVILNDDRLFCAVCYERQWSGWKWFLARIAIDAFLRDLRGEREHCRNAYRRERMERGEVVERVRWAGL